MTRSELRSAARGLWWLLLARGILTIIFGLFALFAPGTALLALVIVFAVYAVNGHWELRVGGHLISGLADSGSPGGRT
jgi:uncharacterized membrane protein HdeD (DUF308 family)